MLGEYSGSINDKHVALWQYGSKVRPDDHI